METALGKVMIAKRLSGAFDLESDVSRDPNIYLRGLFNDIAGWSTNGPGSQIMVSCGDPVISPNGYPGFLSVYAEPGKFETPH